MNSRKMHFRKNWTTSTTLVGFEPRTSAVRLWRINHWATQSTLTGNWSPDLFCSFIKDKPLSYSVNGNWVVFKNNTSICQDSRSIWGRTSSHKIQVNSNPDAKTKSSSTPRHKTNQFRPLNWDQVKFDLPHWNQVKSIPRNEIKSISSTHTKTKSSSMLAIKPSDFRPAYKNQVHFDHPHKPTSSDCEATGWRHRVSPCRSAC